MAISFGRRAAPIGIPSLEQVQNIAQEVASAAENAADATAALVLMQVEDSVSAAETARDDAQAAATTAAADAVAAAQPGIAQAAQTAAAQVAPAAADAIRAQVATDADRAEAAAEALPAERAARASGDERWPSLLESIDGLQHVRINGAGQVVAYTDATSREWVWDANAGEYAPAVDVSPILAVEAEARTAGDERWPSLPIDYLGQDATHLQITESGQVYGYTDASGSQWIWSDGAGAYVTATAGEVAATVTAMVGRVENRSQFDAPSSWQSRQHAARLLEGRLAELGVQKPQRPPVPGQNGGIAPQLSYDHATYGGFDTMCIPSIAIVGRRMWRAEFGRKGVPPGTFAEGNGSFSRLSYCDLDQPGGIAPENWITAAYFHPPSSPGQVKEHLLIETPDGRLGMFFVVYGGWGYQPWGWLLNNAADGEPGSWDFGPPSMIYPGVIADNLGETFTARPYWHGDHQRITIFRMRPPLEADFNPAEHRMIYCRIHYLRDTIELEELATIPAQPNPWATGSWQETSIAPFGQASVVATFRSSQGPYVTVSHNGGDDGTWSAPVRVPHPEAGRASSKTDLSRSPSGRLVWVFHAHEWGRRQLTVALSEDGFQSLVAPYTFDPRGDDGVPISYPYVCFGRNRDGTYDSKIYIAYDRGRGNVLDPATQTYPAEILIAEINEDDLRAGVQAATIHTFTS